MIFQARAHRSPAGPRESGGSALTCSPGRGARGCGANRYQVAIAQEMKLPTFRNDIVFNGHGEGWVLYGEGLAGERGLYMDQLGDRFDVKEFHDVMLGKGSVPLKMLEHMVQEYINAKGAEGI